jgi:hypothetical protein
VAAVASLKALSQKERGAFALGSPSSGTLAAARLKVTTTLNAAEIKSSPHPRASRA